MPRFRGAREETLIVQQELLDAKKRKIKKEVAVERSSVGRKPRQIWVQPGGKIHGACPGKNGWDDAIRGLVPRIVDISGIDWEAQKPEAVQNSETA
jgi:hypothetical protein